MVTLERVNKASVDASLRHQSGKHKAGGFCLAKSLSRQAREKARRGGATSSASLSPEKRSLGASFKALYSLWLALPPFSPSFPSLPFHLSIQSFL